MRVLFDDAYRRKCLSDVEKEKETNKLYYYFIKVGAFIIRPFVYLYMFTYIFFNFIILSLIFINKFIDYIIESVKKVFSKK